MWPSTSQNLRWQANLDRLYTYYPKTIPKSTIGYLAYIMSYIPYAFAPRFVLDQSIGVFLEKKRKDQVCA